MSNVFITGTDTDVGKTTVSAWICMHTNANYWKPIQTGNDSDKGVIRKFSPHTKIISEVYKLQAPLSPYDSANLENREIDVDLLKKDLTNTVIEGAGGALVPIADNFFMVDLITLCNAKALIVAKSKLGMINHVLMTVEVLKNRAIEIVGIVVVGEIQENIKSTVEKFSGLKIIAIIPHTNDLIATLNNAPLSNEILEILL